MPSWAKLVDTATIQRAIPLSKYTAARLGGAADYLYYAQPDHTIEQLVDVIAAAWLAGVPVTLVGGGANVLISDAGVRGLVVVNRISQVEFGQWHDGRVASVTSGVNLQRFAKLCAQQNLTGMEWAVGVPGTIGGALVNNAGAHGTDMAACVGDVAVLTYEKGPQLYSRDELVFDYRTSLLKQRTDRRFLVLLATLCFAEGDPQAIETNMQEFNAYRKRTQPPGASLGSIFKNPPDDYAGRLIEACGLKGSAVGDAQVSPVHANFFINTGQATASDYYNLIEIVQEKVQQQFGVLLEPEIERLGDWT